MKPQTIHILYFDEQQGWTEDTLEVTQEENENAPAPQEESDDNPR